MSPFWSTLLGGIVLVSGAVAVFTMMARLGARQPSPSKIQLRVHRAAGWTFAVTYLVLFYFMLARVDQYWEEASPRVNVHVSLALALLFLLTLKLSIPRFFPSLGKHLFLLGAGLYIATFTMVLLTGGYYVIRSIQKAPYISHAGLPEDLSDQKLGKELFIIKCSTCHTLENIMKARSPESWEKVINDMVAIAQPRIRNGEARQILYYLDKTHVPKRFAGSEAASPVVKYCLPCHASDYLSFRRNSESGWKAIVRKMRDYDPRTIPEDKIPEIVSYLVKNQGID